VVLRLSCSIAGLNADCRDTDDFAEINLRYSAMETRETLRVPLQRSST